jgi:hypothetical protein
MSCGDDAVCRNRFWRAVQSTRGARFGLSSSEALFKTELMAKAWQAHAAVCEAIEGLEPSNDADRALLHAVRLAYREAIRSLERFTADVASEQREDLLRQPADWLSTRDAEAVGFWIAAYAAFSATLASLPNLSGQVQPPEEILIAFEELPDCP